MLAQAFSKSLIFCSTEECRPPLVLGEVGRYLDAAPYALAAACPDCRCEGLKESPSADPLEYCEAEAPQIIIRSIDEENEASLRDFTLQRAVQSGHLDQIRRLLLERANVNARQPLAVGRNFDLGGSRISVGSQVRSLGMTALMYAAQSGYSEACELLLEAKAGVNDEEEDGLRPLHFAAMAGNQEVAFTLMRARADPQKRDDDGRTPLDLVPKCELATKADKARWKNIFLWNAEAEISEDSPRGGSSPMHGVPTPCTASGSRDAAERSHRCYVKEHCGGPSRFKDGERRNQVWI